MYNYESMTPFRAVPIFRIQLGIPYSRSFSWGENSFNTITVIFVSTHFMTAGKPRLRIRGGQLAHENNEYFIS